MFAEPEDRLVAMLQQGKRTYGFGTFDNRPNVLRLLIHGPLDYLYERSCESGENRSTPKRVVFILEDVTRGQTRLTDWDHYYAVEIFCHQHPDGEGAGQPRPRRLMIRENYEPKLMGQMVDYSHLGRHLQESLQANVHLIHISVRSCDDDNHLGHRICHPDTLGAGDNIKKLLSICGGLGNDDDIIEGAVVILGTPDTTLWAGGNRCLPRYLQEQLFEMHEKVARLVRGGIFVGGCPMPFRSG